MYELRRLTVDDLERVEEIERASYPTPWSRSMFVGELGKATSLALGVVDPTSQRLLGYLIVSRYVEAWHVMNLAVDPSCRRAGLATRLLDELFRLGAELDDELGYTLEVRVSNYAAIALYEGLDFSATGIRRGYYTDNREDALIMWRDPLRRRASASATT